jgi:hypothetical protein
VTTTDAERPKMKTPDISKPGTLQLPFSSYPGPMKPARCGVDIALTFLKKFNTGKKGVVRKTCHDFFYQSEPCP